VKETKMKKVMLLLVLGVFGHKGLGGELLRSKLAPADVIYHGSDNSNITLFEPRKEHVRDPKEGAVVFATPSIRLASCYLFRWDDSWVHQSITWNDSNKADYDVYMVISDRERFEKQDKGGSIYLLPSKSFDFDEKKGLGIYEWTSKEKITPLTQIKFVSSLEAMKTLGVKLYFVNADQFKEYRRLPGEKQINFLNNLK
jgi:hypothetical protein